MHRQFLLLGMASISVPWDTLILSVVRIVNATRPWYERALDAGAEA